MEAKAWLPNVLGFKFIAKTIDDVEVSAEVTVYGDPISCTQRKEFTFMTSLSGGAFNG